MLSLKSKRGALTVMECAVLFAVIVAALLAMQIYVKRGFEGRLRTVADQLSDAGFYSPNETVTNSDTEINKNIYTHTANTQDRKGILQIGDHVYKSNTCIGGELKTNLLGEITCEPFSSQPPYLEIKVDETVGPVS